MGKACSMHVGKTNAYMILMVSQEERDHTYVAG
jgi:hypothetical protein